MALRLTSFVKSSKGHSVSLRTTPKPNNFRAFRTNTPVPSLHITKKLENLANVNVTKHSTLQISPKFYVSRPVQFHTTKLIKQEAKPNTAQAQTQENMNGKAEENQSKQKKEELDPQAARIQELEEVVEDYKAKLQYSLAERENILCSPSMFLFFFG